MDEQEEDFFLFFLIWIDIPSFFRDKHQQPKRLCRRRVLGRLLYHAAIILGLVLDEQLIGLGLRRALGVGV